MDKMASSAWFSSCRTWRYGLFRVWNSKKMLCMFIGLNPSTADETNNDPTVTRCIKYAERWGYGGLIMTNIFAYRSTDPNILLRVEDPIGPENMYALTHYARYSKLIVAAWGNWGFLKDQGRQVRQLLVDQRLHILGLNKTGEPKHPLYLKSDLQPVLWNQVDWLA